MAMDGSTAETGRVLVLDDDEAVGATIGLIAETAGFGVRVTSRFADFWALLDTFDPTHVTLDLNMPETDGIEVLRRLAGHGYGGVVIISSGLEPRVLEAAQRSALDHGLQMAGALPKPFRPDDLRRLLARPAERGRGRADAAAAGPDAAGLGAALAARRLTVDYQPKITCATGEVVGFEALARWRDPVLGTVPPDVFVPLAEREGLIGPLTDQVYEAALAWLARLDPNGSTHVALNLSARSLSDLGLADRLDASCRAHGIAPQRVVLELTETASPDDETTALDVLTRFRIRGVSLSIDDFGTGHSTLVQLARQPFSELKIDRQFVTDVATSKSSRTIVRAMVSLAHGLGLTVTAEGVEEPEALAYLVEVGCDRAQGYLIGGPMPGEQVAAWLAERAVRAPVA